MDKPDIPDFFTARKFKQGGEFDPDIFLSKNIGFCSTEFCDFGGCWPKSRYI
jgi:hypothetical protein